jgi:hypothetical protein
LVTKVKPNINSVEVHPQLSNTGHPVDGALVGAGSLGLERVLCVGIHVKQTCMSSTGHCNFAS